MSIQVRNISSQIIPLLPPLVTRSQDTDRTSRLYKDVFTHLANWLTTAELANVSQVNRTWHTYAEKSKPLLLPATIVQPALSSSDIPHLIRQYPKLQCLNLANSLICDADLRVILDNLPHLVSLDLSGCPGITDVGIRLLANFVKGKKITKLDLSGRYNPKFDQQYPVTLARVKEHCIARQKGLPIHFEPAFSELLDLFMAADSDYLDATLSAEEMLAIGHSIRTVSIDAWDELMRSIDFSNIEYFDISDTSYRLDEARTNTWITQLTTCPRLKVCNASFAFTQAPTPATLHRWLTSLPLKQFTQVKVGTVLNVEHVRYIASQFVENFTLEIVKLPLLSEAIDLDDHLDLLDSLHSNAIRYLNYDCQIPEDEELPDEMKAFILKNFPRWSQIEMISLSRIISASELQHAFQVISDKNFSQSSDMTHLMTGLQNNEEFWSRVDTGKIIGDFQVDETLPHLVPIAQDPQVLLAQLWDIQNKIRTPEMEQFDLEASKLRKQIGKVALVAVSIVGILGMTMYTNGFFQAQESQ